MYRLNFLESCLVLLLYLLVTFYVHKSNNQGLPLSIAVPKLIICSSQESLRYLLVPKESPSCQKYLMGSTISEYDLGGEGDLFKAPQPFLADQLMGLDPMTAAISMISCSEDAISPQGLKVSDLETSFENEQLLSEVYYECKKDLFGKDAIDIPISEVLDMKIPMVKADGNLTADENLVSEGSFQKSISSGCLSSMEWIHGAPMRPNFIDFGGMDFGAVYGMRRAFSEGDIKTLGNGNINLIHSPRAQPQIVGTSTSEVRKEQLSRYRNKKNKRNFGRKIKYACRKALADSQPRIRGRFAKTEESDTSKKH